MGCGRGRPVRLQTTIADPSVTLADDGTRRTAKDMDYLVARLHARRSLMAEADRLDSLARIRSLPEFIRAIFPKSEFKEIFGFQRYLVSKLVDEVSGFHIYMSGPGADLINWTLVRFQIENLKVLMRALLTGVSLEELEGNLIPLPKELAINVQKLAAAESPEGFVRLVPNGLIRENLDMALDIYRENPRPFFFEAALDRAYFQGLIARTEKLKQEDREIIRPIVYQEVDIFLLMLVARGKFYYGLTPEVLQPFHVRGTRIRSTIFATMLNDPDLYTAVVRVGERVLNAMPFERGTGEGSNAVDASQLEGLAWNRFFRLANLAFRRSHMGLGAIMGYVVLRRLEVANLITISEGIHGGMAAEAIRGRLIPRADVEGVYV